MSAVSEMRGECGTQRTVAGWDAGADQQQEMRLDHQGDLGQRASESRLRGHTQLSAMRGHVKSSRLYGAVLPEPSVGRRRDKSAFTPFSL